LIEKINLSFFLLENINNLYSQSQMSDITISTISAAKGYKQGHGFFRVKSKELKLTHRLYERSKFRIKKVKGEVGIKYGYHKDDDLAIIILVSDTGLDIDNQVATVDTSDHEHWKIIFQPLTSQIDNIALFKLTRKEADDSRTGYLWFYHPHNTNNADGDKRVDKRVLRFANNPICKSVTFSSKTNDPVILHIRKVGEGAGYFANEKDFF
jgi:hypothetical protein